MTPRDPSLTSGKVNLFRVFRAFRGYRLPRIRQTVQLLALSAYLFLVVATVRDAATWLPLDLFLRLDPLAALVAWLSGRQLTWNFALAGLTLLATFGLGRVWCGWVCPLGTVLDTTSPRPKERRRAPAPAWRSAKYFALFAVFVAALLANATLMVLDPITILNRSLAVAILPGFSWLATAAEVALYPVEFLQGALEAFEKAFRGNLLASQQPFYQLNVLLTLFLIAIVALNRVSPRFWCRYICPLGAMLALAARSSRLTPVFSTVCDNCARCVAACPTGAIAANRDGLDVDPTECTLCLDCLESCPQKALSLRLKVPVLHRHPYDPSRRTALLSAVGAVGGLALLRTGPAARWDNPWLVRPPGALDTDFIGKCIRCAECVKVCPTNGLQPALFEAGLEGFWTPVLVSRLGPCDYSCNACGQICPTGAIPPLTLAEKREKIIGTAYIDKGRCLPYANSIPCIVCEEMCPLPDKAVKLDEADAVDAQGRKFRIKLPRVVLETCIGCGICEYQCPLKGPAAIRVYVPQPSRSAVYG
ncbi:MAG: 4Fe-4S binding protein [Chloroflexi bacterium]|nr:4Fe-4S binding protein [Chloroflexota bacterium]